ncbi:MAG: porin [Thermodesulfobacteriota bacterium]
MRKLLVLLSAVAFLVAFTVPAVAADWNFYGSARMYTFINDVTPAEGDSDDDLSWFLQGNSRIGAMVKAGDISGRFEYGSGPSLRLLNGAWNFGAGSLLVGQDYSPVDVFISNQQGPAKWGGDIDMLAYGGIYDGRVPQIKLSMAGFQLALLEPKGATLEGLGDTDTSIPRIEASYTFKAGPLALKVLGGYNTCDIELGSDSYGIDSNVFGLMAKYATGPFSIAGNYYMAQNAGNYGLLQDAAFGTAAVVDNSVEDSDSAGYLLVVGFKASDMIRLEAGYGNVSNERGDLEAEVTSYYLQAPIALAKGMSLVPEYGVVEYDVGGEDAGDISYYGTKWQIDF